MKSLHCEQAAQIGIKDKLCLMFNWYHILLTGKLHVFYNNGKLQINENSKRSPNEV